MEELFNYFVDNCSVVKIFTWKYDFKMGLGYDKNVEDIVVLPIGLFISDNIFIPYSSIEKVEYY